MGIDPKEGWDLIAGTRTNECITEGYINRLKEIEASRTLTEQFRSLIGKEQREMLDPKKRSGAKFEPELSDKWLKNIYALGDKQNRRLAKD